MIWTCPPESITLDPEDAHVWRLPLDRPAGVIERAAGVLSDAEQARAGRFRFDRDRDCYMLTRARLRRLLGTYLGRPAPEVALFTGSYGKPAVSAAQQPPCRLEFNVSHSRDYALLAFARRRRVGIDVEFIRSETRVELVGKDHFRGGEYLAITGGPDATILERFYECWTRKEAYIKAIGRGLSMELDSFEVSVGQPAALRWTAAGDAHAWQMTDISVDDGYAATVCLEGESPVDIHWWDVV